MVLAFSYCEGGTGGEYDGGEEESTREESTMKEGRRVRQRRGGEYDRGGEESTTEEERRVRGRRGGEYDGGGEESTMKEGKDGRRLISEQLTFSCAHHTYLLFSEVDVGQSEVDCVQVGGVGDIVHCSLVAVLSRGEVPHQKVCVA